MARLFGTTPTITQPTEGGRLFTSARTENLQTLAGLEQLAKKQGLGKESEKILAGKGEDPEKIFSGGVVSDIFDTLNALQYGVVGVLKGKSFKEGMRTRESFSKKDALGEFGVPGLIGGIALDIAVDPLTYVPIVGLGKVALKGVKGVAQVAGKVAIKTIPGAQQVGDTLGRAFIYRFGQDPIYKEIAERSTKNIAVGIENMIDVVRPITKLDTPTQRAIAVARKAGKLDELPKELLDTARPAFDELDRLGNEAVEAGLLKKDIYEQNVGQYISRLYRKHEISKGVVERVKGFFEPKPLRINLERFKKRTDIPEDVREVMGEILEAGYPTAKSLVQLTQAVERAKFFKVVAGKWAKDTIEDGFQKLPDVKTLGELAGKAVPTSIFDDIQEIIRVRSPLEKGLNKVVAGFKFSKVILNPATHARNIMSNFVLNNFEGLSPARIDIYAKAAKQLAIKGDLYKEAKSVGLGVDTFASAELKSMLQSPEVSKLGSAVRDSINKIAGLYQKEEEFAKMAQYIFQRSKGLNPEEAIKIAERATFNYAQVTPFIRRMRESIFGYPFITFTYKVTPQVARTLVTKPTKISNIGKIKQAIENQSDLKELSAERATEPEWVRDGFYVKLPMKDKFGRSSYLDLTYIMPFGDMVSGQIFERDIKRETGLPEGTVEAQLKKLPFFNLLRELGKNQDFFGNKIWLESDGMDKQLGDVMRHISKTYLPPLVGDQLSGGYRASGERRPPLFKRVVTKPEQLETGGAQQRTLSQELLRQVGLKISPVDLGMQATFSEREKIRALETLLKERGEIAEFKRTFVPKEKKQQRGRLFQSQ